MPVKVTLWLLGEALSVKFKEAVSGDPMDGLNVIMTVQVPVGGTVVLMPGTHVEETMAKSAAFVPVMPGVAVNINAALPVFVKTTLCGALVDPMLTTPNDTVEGRLTAGVPAKSPVPVRLTL